MTVIIGGERVARLTEFRRRAKTLIDQLKAAKTQQESRVVLTTHGEPVVVVQEYGAYQELLSLLDKLQFAEARERTRLLNEGKINTVPLDEVIEQYDLSQDNVSG